MNKFKNPDVPLITNPVNIDRPIQEIQIALAGLGWLDKVFGRSWLAYKTTQGIFSSKQKTYPHVWQGLTEAGKPKDLLEVLPNDNIRSQAFFKVEDPIKILEYVPDGNSIMQANTSIIFWFNLRRIDDTIDYPFVELLKGQAQRVLTEMLFLPDSSLEIVNIWEGAANVFRGYDITEVKDQELVYPWGGFRFECLITYREECPNTLYDITNGPPGLIMANGGYIARS